MFEENPSAKMLDKSSIKYVDSSLRNYENISPEEVANYYKSLGDWQNELTKTDYTYSPLSVYYKKKINGVYPVIPNMSRPSLWSYEFSKDTVEILDNIFNAKKEQYFLHSQAASDDMKTAAAPRWAYSGKRSSSAILSMFTHFCLFSLFIIFVLFSLRGFSFYV